MVPSVSSTRQGQRQSALTPAHAQHQDLVSIGGFGLVEDQRDGLPGLGQPDQDLAGERFHNHVAAHQSVGQKPGNPLISHVPAFGFSPQPGGQFDQVGAAHMQHGSRPKPPCWVPIAAHHRRRPRTTHLQYADLTGSKGISLSVNITALAKRSADFLRNCSHRFGVTGFCTPIQL
jgi:hypothetical protein